MNQLLTKKEVEHSYRQSSTIAIIIYFIDAKKGMSETARPNRRRVELITLALNANTVHELVTSHGLSLIKDCLCLLTDFRKNEDKALMIDFCCRHGGLTKVVSSLTFE